jgi:hypothetical protein
MRRRDSELKRAGEVIGMVGSFRGFDVAAIQAGQDVDQSRLRVLSVAGIFNRT